MLKMRNISEALEKRYSLNEKFDDSMPKWLKDAIATETIMTNTTGREDGYGYGRYARYRKASDKYPDAAYFHDYRGDEDMHSSGLFKGLLAHDIDLSKVKVVEAPVPDKMPRRSSKNPIIPIFLLKNGQVYARGINDKEYFHGWRGYGTRSKTFKGMGEDILNYTVAYCYIPLNSPDNADAIGTVLDKQAERRQLRDDLLKLPSFRYSKKWVDHFKRYRSVPGGQSEVDKSGYSPDENKRRYRDYAQRKKEERERERAKKLQYELPEKFEAAVDRYKEYRQEISVMLSSDVDDVHEDYLKILRLARECISMLGDVATQLSASQSNMDYAITSDDITYFNSASRNIDMANEYLDSCDSMLEVERKAIVDW